MRDTLDVLRSACHNETMIRSFKDKDTQSLSENRYVKAFDSIQLPARRKLDLLNAAHGLQDLAAVPGNRLEALHGDRAGQHSIRIYDQYRICFVADGEDFTDVEITDYH